MISGIGYMFSVISKFFAFYLIKELSFVLKLPKYGKTKLNNLENCDMVDDIMDCLHVLGDF